MLYPLLSSLYSFVSFVLQHFSVHFIPLSPPLPFYPSSSLLISLKRDVLYSLCRVVFNLCILALTAFFRLRMHAYNNEVTWRFKHNTCISDPLYFFKSLVFLRDFRCVLQTSTLGPLRLSKKVGVRHLLDTAFCDQTYSSER